MTMMRINSIGRRRHATHERCRYLIVLSLVVGLAVAGCGRKGPLTPLKPQTPVLSLPTRGAFCCAAERS
jgi:Prokaryotic lipoprotein-attachment site